MGARGGRSATRKGSCKHSGGLKSGHLLASSSDGIEGSCSSNSHSCGSINDPGPEVVYPTQGGAMNHVQYVNSDGSIFTLASNSNQFSGTSGGGVDPQQRHLQQHQQKQHQQQQQELSYQSQSADSTNSLSTTNLEAPGGKKLPIELPNAASQNQQQQHRRLQRQVHQQLQRIYGNAGRQGQRLTGQVMSERHLLKRQKQHQLQQHNLAQNDHQSFEFDDREQRQQQHMRRVMRGQQHPMIAVKQQRQQSQQEQTYDSLSPAASMASKAYHHQQGDGFYAHDVQGQVPICSIPEEGNGDEEELLLPDAIISRPKSEAINRKNHLENLHYATVTAAALLSATADAAAALAATADKKRPNELQHFKPKINQENPLNAIYSETYQEIRRQRACHDDQVNQAAMVRSKHQQQEQQQQYLHRVPIYTADSVDLAPNSRRAHLGMAASTSALYGHLARVPQLQPKIYSINHLAQRINHQQQQFKLQNHGRLPQLPLRRLPNQFNPMSTQAELIRQHQQSQRHQMLLQQQQQRTQARQKMSALPALLPPVPALAILHHRNAGKIPSAEANLISRLLVNNIVAAQRATAFTVDPSHYRQYSLGNGNGAHVNNKPAIENSQALVGRVEPTVHGAQARGEKLYGVRQGPTFPLPTMVAPSDSSGHSSVPLVLDQNIRPLGIIERICQIDLTIFWWSLLIVCFFFICTIIAISRYVF